MITEGHNNTLWGQFQEFTYNVLQDVRLKFDNNSIYIQDPAGQDVIRFILDDGLLKYSLYQNGSWGNNQSITTPDVSENDSTTLPHTQSNSRIDISNDMFRVYLQNVLYMQLSTSALTAKLSLLTIDNATYDLVIQIKMALGQKLQIKNSDTNTTLLDISNSSINIYNKPLLGVASSVDISSAVPLGDLQQYQPQFMRARGPSNQAVIYNTQQLPIAQFTSNDVVMKKPVRYDPRPDIFQNTTLTDVQQVNSIVAEYQPLSGKDQVLGYAGLDINSRIYTNRLPLSAATLTGDILQTASGQFITTASVPENTNLYYTDSRVNNYIDSIKGIASGLCPLNASSKVPAQFIDSLQLGGTYSGLDAQKTNQLNPAYSQSQPVTGDQYITTDSGSIYILKDIPFTSASNWILLTSGGVTSVNGLQGVVSLSTDNIGEGLVNQYFASGINGYKNITANQPNELLKLDSQGHMPGSYLGTELTLQGGFATIQDNQTSHIRFLRASDSNVLLELDNAGFVLGRKAAYDFTPTINSNLDIPTKQYVDTEIQNHIPIKIQDSNTQVLAEPTSITTTVENISVSVATQGQIQANVPVLYNNVQVTQADQLATKQYVDNTLANFINVSGASKQYLQATSNIPITTNGRITNWNVNIQSDEDTRLSLDPVNSIFQVKDKTYRFYLGIQIKEFTEVDLVQITVQLRDANTHQAYFYYDFSNDFSSTGGDQSLSMSLPFIWKFANDTSLEVYVNSSQMSFGVYNAYIMIEEFQNYEFAIGADRITDPGAFSKLQITSHTLDFNLNGSDKMQLTTDSLVLEPGIRILQDQNTSNTNPQQLVPKSYVDEQVNLANVSISKLGQVVQVGMSANQIIQVGQTVLFDTQQLNTSITISVNNGTFTFTQGFIYRIQYKISGRFLNGGTAQLVFRDVDTLQNVTSSTIYLTYNSQDTSGTFTTFYLDLRTEVAPKSYNVILLSATNLQQIYKNYSLLQAEQVQIINDLFFDRIETPGQVSQLKLYQEELNYKLNGDLVAIASNDSQNFNTQLQIDNKAIINTSTINSTSIVNKTVLDNGTAGIQRNAYVTANVGSDVSVVMSANMSSGNVPSASITAPLADTLELGTSTVALHITDQYTTSNNLIVYDNSLVPTNAKHLIPKEYADNNFYTNTTPLNNITAPTGNLDMNSHKITGLSLPSANSDAASKQYVDSVSGGSTNQIINSVVNTSKLTANQTEITNGSTPINMNSQKITSLADATTATDALNRQTADSRYYLNTTTLNSITAPTSSLSLNSQKITSLADATTATDALNRQTGDGRYYLNTTTLNSITAPTASLSMNSQKITSVANPSVSSDVVTLDYLLNTYRPYYSFTINIGDIPSGEESFASTDNVITNVVYTNSSSASGKWTVTVDSPNVFAGADYSVLMGIRSLRGSTSTIDNDLGPLLISEYYKTSFVLYIEETSTSTQNVAIDGILVRRA